MAKKPTESFDEFALEDYQKIIDGLKKQNPLYKNRNFIYTK